MTALVIAEHDNASIKPATLNTVTAAAQCGGDVHVLVAGKGAEAAAKAAAAIAGVAKVIHVEGEHFAHGLAENMAAQVVAIASAYSHILFPATASGKNIAPRVAATLDVGQISDITKVDAADTFERPIYAGNAIAIVQSLDATKVITVRTTGFDAAAATGGSAAIETPAGVADSGKSSFLGAEIAKSERPELTAARVIISGGRALGSAENFAIAGQGGGQAGRRRRCLPRRRGRRLRAERPPGGPDRQDRLAGAVHRGRHLGRHPAPGRHEGQQGHRRHQQGRGGADLPAWPTTAWWATCSRPCLNWLRLSL
jgi:electron transfer flavoprotein alpha subunit